MKLIRSQYIAHVIIVGGAVLNYYKLHVVSSSVTAEREGRGFANDQRVSGGKDTAPADKETEERGGS
jgi:hypothetical protein